MRRGKKDKQPRNYLAIDAWFRNSAGPMKDHGDKYECRKFRHKRNTLDWDDLEYYNEIVDAEPYEEEEHEIWWKEYKEGVNSED